MYQFGSCCAVKHILLFDHEEVSLAFATTMVVYYDGSNKYPQEPYYYSG